MFYHSIGTLRLLCNLLDLDAKNPNYTLEVRACMYVQSIFSSLIYSLFPSLFFCPWAFTVLYFSRRGFRKTPRVQEVHFKAFQVLVKQDFHWNIF